MENRRAPKSNLRRGSRRILTMNATIKPGDVVLACTRRKVFAITAARVWISCGGTVRVDAKPDGRLRPGTSFDARQCLTLGALENLSR